MYNIIQYVYIISPLCVQVVKAADGSLRLVAPEVTPRLRRPILRPIEDDMVQQQ
jgi:hypothetical protein